MQVLAEQKPVVEAAVVVAAVAAAAETVWMMEVKAAAVEHVPPLLASVSVLSLVCADLGVCWTVLHQPPWRYSGCLRLAVEGAAVGVPQRSSFVAPSASCLRSRASLEAQ